MRPTTQVTGSKLVVEEKKIKSIQLSPGGLYYALSNDCASAHLTGVVSLCDYDTLEDRIAESEIFAGDCDVVNVVLDTIKAVPVPGEFFHEQSLPIYFKGSNMLLSPQYRLVAGREVSGVRMVMECRRDIADLLESRFADVRYYSPLQVNIMRSRPGTLYINISDNSYITFEDRRLQYAEALQGADRGDILYEVSKVAHKFGKAVARTVVAGQGAQEMSVELSKYLKKVYCENSSLKRDVKHGDDKLFNIKMIAHANNKWQP